MTWIIGALEVPAVVGGLNALTVGLYTKGMVKIRSFIFSVTTLPEEFLSG